MLNSKEALQDFQQIIAADPNLAEFCAGEQSWIKSRRQDWERDRIRVGVIGVTSSGKSTLVNAILGRQLLSSAVAPSSGQLVCCSHGKEEVATVRFLNGQTKKLFGKKLEEEIRQYSDERSNPKNQKGVLSIELSTPAFDLGKDVLLIDSPGLDAYGHDDHEKLTLESLVPTIDACIYVTTTKQNSDRKTKNVLDIVAKYHCPIIIVQNMLDAVMASPSGDKSREQVAQEHKLRVRRIIDRSDIEDKENVKIIQMSAKFAVPWRCHLVERGAKEKQQYLESRYPQFRDSVRSILAHQRPRIERQRLGTIYERAANLQKAAQSKISVPAQKLESVFPLTDFRGQFRDSVKAVTERSEQAFARYVTACDEIRKALPGDNIPADHFNSTLNASSFLLSALFSSVSGAKKNRWSLETCVKKTNETVDALGHDLEGIISDCNALINKAAGSVNIPNRDLLRSVSIPAQRDIHMEKKVIHKPERVKSSGLFSGVARFFGDLFDKDWGYEYRSVEKTVNDEDATKENILHQLATVGTRYEKTMQDWFSNSFEPAVHTVLQSIEELEETYNRQKQAVVEADRLRHMCEKLAQLLGRLERGLAEYAGNSRTEGPLPTDAPLYHEKLQIDAAGYIRPLMELSRYAVRAQHRQLFRAFIEKIGCLEHTPVIIGWDDISRDKLLWQSGIMDALCLCPEGELDKLSCTGPLCLFVLVNTTQFGEAMKQVDALHLQKQLSAADRVIWVVQDLQELLNSGNAGDGLAEMLRMGSYTHIPCESFFYVCHENPLYAWAFLELQLDPSLAENPHLLINAMQEEYHAFTNSELETTLGHLLPDIHMPK